MSCSTGSGLGISPLLTGCLLFMNLFPTSDFKYVMQTKYFSSFVFNWGGAAGGMPDLPSAFLREAIAANRKTPLERLPLPAIATNRETPLRFPLPAIAAATISHKLDSAIGLKCDPSQH
eukprot:410110-Amphidinium_carterae.1